MPEELARPKSLVIGFSIAAVIYSVLVLGYVGTSPDIGLRGLLADGDLSPDRPGMMIRKVVDLTWERAEPRPGDVLTQIHDQPIRSFLDFAYILNRLRNATVSPSGHLDPDLDLSAQEPRRLPSLVVQKNVQKVEVQFYRPSTGEQLTGWLTVQSLPLMDVLLSFVWLVLQLGIFAVSVLAAWHRPYDRSARLFFAMCAVSMGGFIGGFHWWVISGSLLLTVPFLVCALFVPTVSLHFYLSYPRPLAPMTRHPKTTLLVIYITPAVASVVMLGLLLLAWGLRTTDATGVVSGCLTALRFSIYFYLTFAAVCFFTILAALSGEYMATTSPVERNQMKWMLRAGVAAAVLIGYTLYLAMFDWAGFALGRASVPMFLASVSFTLAYTIGIVRFKLMFVDQLVTRGMLYFSATHGLTMGYGVCVALVAFFANNLKVPATLPGWFQQALSLGALLTFSVVVLTWSRDRLQQSIDRRFYREKYQLDKALQRVNRALDRLEDRHALGLRMLTSCREVLNARRGALYLREAGSSMFQLVAMDGPGVIPEQFSASDELLERLRLEAALQRSSATPGDQVFRLLRDLHCELMFGLQTDGQVDGIVVLARRQDSSPYTAEDLTFLNTLGQFTSVALRSVKVHQDFARLNEELQLKVSKIDEQKRQIAMMQSELTGGAPGHDKPESEEVPHELRRDMIKGNSAAIRDVLETVRKVAASESTVLIQGSSGTGKELLAQAIHENSVRRNGPLVRVHCAALSPSLLESELFGHVKGAFTGAHQNRIGRFEMANGGTLFLDEIGDISLETQIKLLRVLQTRSFEPVGGTRTVTVDVRLITATHQNLQKLIAEGRFRDDLFYRLNVINITLPTLRERQDDIFELALYFLVRSSQKCGKRITHIDEEALEGLKRYHWPGNIRELENVIERAVVLCDGDCITLRDLPPEVIKPAGRPRMERALESMTSAEPVSLFPPETGTAVASPRHEVIAGPVTEELKREVELLQKIMRECRGNKSEAARKLGVPRSTLFSRLKKAGLS